MVTAASLVAAGAGGCAGPAKSAAAERPAGVAQRSGPPERADKIVAVHRAHRAQIRSCFDKTADGSPSESPPGLSQVEVELGLPRSGSPASIRLLRAKSLPADFRFCLEGVLADIDYGRARSGGTYYQVLSFDADEDRLTFDAPVDAYHRWGLTGDEIKSVVAEHESDIDACYRQATGSPEGRLVVTFIIAGDGRVARVGAKSSTLDAPRLKSCVVEGSLDMEFPPPRGGGVVVYDLPMIFEAADGWTP